MPVNVNPSICVRVRLSNTLTINRIKTVKGLCAAVAAEVASLTLQSYALVVFFFFLNAVEVYHSSRRAAGAEAWSSVPHMSITMDAQSAQAVCRSTNWLLHNQQQQGLWTRNVARPSNHFYICLYMYVCTLCFRQRECIVLRSLEMAAVVSSARWYECMSYNTLIADEMSKERDDVS